MQGEVPQNHHLDCFEIEIDKRVGVHRTAADSVFRKTGVEPTYLE